MEEQSAHGNSEKMKRLLTILLAGCPLLILVLFAGCSRKAAPSWSGCAGSSGDNGAAARCAARAGTRRDARRFHQRQHQRAGAGLHRLARLQGRQYRQKGRSSFSDRSAAVRGCAGSGQGNSGERPGQLGKGRCGSKARDRSVQQEGDQRSGARHCHRGCRLQQSKRRSGRSSGETGRAQSWLHKNHCADRRAGRIREQSGRRSGRSESPDRLRPCRRSIRSKPT